MATNIENCLNIYRQFFSNFATSINPNDQLPVKLASYKLNDDEIVGGVVDWTLQYLNQKHCPASLTATLVRVVIDEMKQMCANQPAVCGFNRDLNAYEPLKLMKAVMNKVNDVCLRYLDNSELYNLRTMLQTQKIPQHYAPAVSAFAIKNTRRQMEDRLTYIDDLNTVFNIQDANGPSSYYAIFDGHAGIDAASYSSAHLHQYLAESVYYRTNPERALREAFVRTDAAFVDKAQKENLNGGTTAVCALYRPKQYKLYVAWVGDSMALLVNHGCILQIVQPHRPSRVDEKERITEMGGHVSVWSGGVWRVDGTLAISRAIGDAKYKPYVTGDPDIAAVPLDGGEDFLIIATDGLWDCVTEDQAAAYVYRQIFENPDDTTRISKNLVQLAKEQGSSDNISVIVVFLRDTKQIAKTPLPQNITGWSLQNNFGQTPDSPNRNGESAAARHHNNQQTTDNNMDLELESALDNSNNPKANNPFVINNSNQKMDTSNLLDHLIDTESEISHKQNGTTEQTSPHEPTNNDHHDLFYNNENNLTVTDSTSANMQANGKRSADEFEYDEDESEEDDYDGPETDVDGAVLHNTHHVTISPTLEAAKALAEGIVVNNNPFAVDEEQSSQQPSSYMVESEDDEDDLSDEIHQQKQDIVHQELVNDDLDDDEEEQNFNSVQYIGSGTDVFSEQSIDTGNLINVADSSSVVDYMASDRNLSTPPIDTDFNEFVLDLLTPKCPKCHSPVITPELKTSIIESLDYHYYFNPTFLNRITSFTLPSAMRLKLIKQSVHASRRYSISDPNVYTSFMIQKYLPIKKVLENSGFVVSDNVAESGAEDTDDEEWSYLRGDKNNIENHQNQFINTNLQSDQQYQEKQEQEVEKEEFVSKEEEKIVELEQHPVEDMSQLNPDAAEFVPVSPVRDVPTSPQFKNDIVIAESPKRPKPLHQLPSDIEFLNEVRQRPSNIDESETFTLTDLNKSQTESSSQILENIVNGKDVNNLEFHSKSSSEAYFTNAEFSAEDDAPLLTHELLQQPKTTDPMCSSIYEEKGVMNLTSDGFDLNAVQMLPDDVNEFIKSGDDESDKENDPLYEVEAAVENAIEREIENVKSHNLVEEKEQESPMDDKDKCNDFMMEYTTTQQQQEEVVSLSQGASPMPDNDAVLQIQESSEPETVEASDVYTLPSSANNQMDDELVAKSPEMMIAISPAPESPMPPEPVTASPVPDFESSAHQSPLPPDDDVETIPKSPEANEFEIQPEIESEKQHEDLFKQESVTESTNLDTSQSPLQTESPIPQQSPDEDEQHNIPTIPVSSPEPIQPKQDELPVTSEFVSQLDEENIVTHFNEGYEAETRFMEDQQDISQQEVESNCLNISSPVSNQAPSPHFDEKDVIVSPIPSAPAEDSLIDVSATPTSLPPDVNSFLERSPVPDMPLSPMVSELNEESLVDVETVSEVPPAVIETQESVESRLVSTPPPTPAVSGEPAFISSSPEPSQLVEAVGKLNEVEPCVKDEISSTNDALAIGTAAVVATTAMTAAAVSATKKPTSTSSPMKKATLSSKTTSATKPTSLGTKKPLTPTTITRPSARTSSTTASPKTPTTTSRTPLSASKPSSATKSTVSTSTSNANLRSAPAKKLTNGEVKPKTATTITSIKKTSTTTLSAGKTSALPSRTSTTRTAAPKPLTATTARTTTAATSKLTTTSTRPLSAPAKTITRTTVTATKSPLNGVGPKSATAISKTSAAKTLKPTSTTSTTSITRSRVSPSGGVSSTVTSTTTTASSRPRTTLPAKKLTPNSKTTPIDKQIKETTNKQLSSSTTARTTATKPLTSSTIKTKFSSVTTTKKTETKSPIKLTSSAGLKTKPTALNSRTTKVSTVTHPETDQRPPSQNQTITLVHEITNVSIVSANNEMNNQQHQQQQHEELQQDQLINKDELLVLDNNDTQMAPLPQSPNILDNNLIINNCE